MAESVVVTPGTDSALKLRLINREIEEFVDSNDLITGLSGVSKDPRQLPDACIQTVDMPDMVGEKVQRLMMQLQEDGFVGDLTVAENTGEFPREKTLIDRVNVYGKVLNRKSPLMTIGGHLLGKDFFTMSRTLLPKWISVQRGIYFRQTMIERVPTLLTGTPWELDSGWNPHIYVQGCPIVSQPVYDIDSAVYEANIMAALAAVPFTNDSTVVYDTFVNLTYYTDTVWRIVRPGGNYGGTIQALIGPRSAVSLQRYSSEGSIFQVRKSSLSEQIVKMAFPTGNGRGLGEGMGFNFLVDERAPIMVYDTLANGGAGSLTVIYRGHGETDERAKYVTTDTIKVFEVCPLLGKGALRNPVARRPNYYMQDKDFGRLDQVMALAIEGFNIPAYDEPVAGDRTSTTLISQRLGLLLIPVIGQQ